MAILSDYRGEDQQQQQHQQQRQRQQAKPQKTFCTVFYPTNPLGFLQSAFEFVLAESEFFRNESSEKEVGCLARKMREKLRAEEEEKEREKKKIELQEKQRMEELEKKKKIEQEKASALEKTQDQAPVKDDPKESKKVEDNPKKENKKEEAKPKCEDPNKGNGFDLDKYSWVQNLQELTVNVPVRFGTKPSSIICDIKKNHLKVGVQGQPLIIDGEHRRIVKPDGSFWSMEDKKAISILITKKDQLEWWRCLVKGDPLIDTQKVRPENSKLSDLDLETRSTVDKMMFDQRQKERDCQQMMRYRSKTCLNSLCLSILRW